VNKDQGAVKSPPVLFCRLYLISTSGVCLPPQAPLAFPLKKTTLAKCVL
jgi:hypothetical protein